MSSRHLQDIVAGLLLTSAGVAVSVHAMLSYTMGTLQRMGPGMFPFGAGLVLAFLGLVVLIPAFVRQGGALPAVSVRPLLSVLASIAAFALLIRTAGMMPAIVAMTLIGTMAETTLRWWGALALALALCLLAWLIFIVGLGLPIPLYRWPL